MNITEELKNEVGNAIAAYGRILHSALLGTDVPPGFEKLKECTDEELKHKMQILKEFYSPVINIKFKENLYVYRFSFIYLLIC